MNENQDLLDLCRLNIIEDNAIENNKLTDDDKKAIAWKKKRLSEKLKSNAPSFSEEQIKKHKALLTDPTKEILEEDFLIQTAEDFDIELHIVQSIFYKCEDKLSEFYNKLECFNRDRNK